MTPLTATGNENVKVTITYHLSGEDMMNTRPNDKNEKAQLIRLLYMLLYGFVLYLTLTLVAIVVVVQFVFALFTGRANASIGEFSKDLARFIEQVVLFLSYNSEKKPYPFNPLYDEVEVEAIYDKDETLADYEDIEEPDDESNSITQRPDR